MLNKWWAFLSKRGPKSSFKQTTKEYKAAVHQEEDEKLNH